MQSNIELNDMYAPHRCLTDHYVISKKRKQPKSCHNIQYYYVNGSDLSGIENEHTQARCASSNAKTIQF